MVIIDDGIARTSALTTAQRRGRYDLLVKYDLVVVGAGAAGATIAARVSEDARRSVILLEAGPYYPTTADMPDDLLNGHNNSYTAHDWRYHAFSNAEGRDVFFPRGRVVGGSSAVNTAIALRGVPEDYDEWAALGNDAWAWDKVLPYFRRLEDDQDVRNEFHGTGGPVPITRYREHELTPVQQAFVTAMRDLGYPETFDNNDPTSSGLGPHPMNRRGRTRMSVAICYLEPARERANLTIRGNCHVRRVVLNARRAIAVEVISDDGSIERIEGDRVLIAAGAIATPAILMRSGIGPAAHLEEHGIEIVCDLPGVGANLDDHPMLGVAWLARPEAGLDLDHPLVQVTCRYTSSLGEERNDMQLMPVSQLPGPNGHLVFSIGTVVERQKSRGRVTLQSPDARMQPRIESNFCDDPDDVARLVEGAKMALHIGAHPAFDAIRERRLAPSEATVASDSQLASWVRHVASSGFHPSCTAKMGPDSDPMAVVDQYLKVRSFENLYVADASVMPTCPRANIHLTSIMIGERAGEWLREGAI